MVRLFLPGALVLLLLGLSACGGGGSGDAGVTPLDPDAPAPPPVDVPAASSLQQLVERESNTACLAPDLPPGLDTQFRLNLAFPELPDLGSLLGMEQTPGASEYWFAYAREGRIWRFLNEPDVQDARLVFDISAVVDDFGELGLLGLALHPEFSSNGYLYIYYSPSRTETRLSRFHFDAGVVSVDPGDELVLLRVDQPRSNHNGGGLAFGPDGFLYLSLGDGGGAFDQFGNGQNTQSWQGALLRLDVDGTEPSAIPPYAIPPYAIPPDNPFADSVGGLPEIYAYGLRNAWRMSFDQLTGELWAGDVGQGAREEVNRLVAGGNYGWPIMEGSRCLEEGCDVSLYQPPAFEYRHANGECAIIGGYVYRGAANASLFGRYIYGDYCSGNIYSVQGINTGSPAVELAALSGMNITGFAQDAAGELYVLDIAGGVGAGIYQLATGESISAPQSERLSEVGCFKSLTPLALADGIYSYDIASTLWSDGANKQRFFAVPDATGILPSLDGDLVFPAGSVLIKHFYLDERIVETRLLMRHRTGWQGYSYAWNAAQSEAFLQDSSEVRQIDGSDYYYPSQGECLECHTAAAAFVLGPDVMQMNSVIVAGESNLEALDRLGLLGFAEQILPVHLNTEIHGLDAEVDAAARARSYLHSNCSSCHRENAPAGFMDLRRQVPLADMGICDVEPSQGDMGIENARRLAPMEPERSLLLQRMLDRGQFAMPPLATLEIDVEAAEVVREWILTLQNCSGALAVP